MATRSENGQYIIEFHQKGKALKVSAIDPRTGEEACIVGDPAASEKELTRLAIQKLHYVQRKNRQE